MYSWSPVVTIGLAILQIVVVPMVAYVAWVIRDIRTKVNSMDVRLSRIEEWSRGHEKLDDERFEGLTHRIEAVFQAGRRGV